MSHVYVARDTYIGRTVAVKILTDSGALDDATRARFVREAQLAGNIVHDNIIRVYDFGEENGRLFMVMELLEGEDLNDAIRNGRTGNIDNRVDIAIQVAKAMEYIHTLKIVHRDLKPHNVFMTRAGVAKLMDFGIAKTDETSVTKTGFALGTPSYMAPEQVLGKPVSHLSDIYSFGIMLFELITDTKPLTGDSVERVFWRILNDPVDLTSLRVKGAPERLCELVHRCTEKNPEARPQSFTEVRQELEAIQGYTQPDRARSAASEGMMTQAMPAASTAGARGTAASATPALSTAPVEEPEEETPAVAEPARVPPKWMWVAVSIAGVLVVAVGLYLFLRPKPQPSAQTTQPNGETKTAEVSLSARLSMPSGDMILIAAGPFLSGESNVTQTLPAYYIDRTEVTNRAYDAFLKATQYSPPPGFKNARPDYPVVNVNMADAREFARWAGKRIPTAAEWEKAARGTDGRLYPWGDIPGLAPAAVKGTADLRPADTASASSPYGLLEMEGNVWELVDHTVTPSPGALQALARVLTPPPTATEPWCTIRGGSFRFPLVKLWDFSSYPERMRRDDVGFRCARDIR